MQQSSSSSRNALLCALLLILCTLAALPFAETGLNDDWSYIRSAQTLAQTGHIAYFGWASAMLGWQLPLGALFIKLFGFSFSITRFSVLLVSALTAFLLQRSFVRCGLQERNATLGTLVFVLSPLFLPLAFSFMSDVPGIFATVLCLYLCLRAIQAETDRAAFLWLVVAALSNAIGGTARQTAWFGLLVMVPSTFWLIRHRRPPILLAAIVWLAGIGILFGSMRWFAHQPYSLREKVIAGYVDRDLLYHMVANVARGLVELSVFLLPVLIAFAPRLPRRNAVVLRAALAFAVLLPVAALFLSRAYPASEWLAPFAVVGNFVSPRGLVDVPEIGAGPLILPIWFQALLTLAALAAAIAFLAFLADWFQHRGPSAERALSPASTPSLSWRQFWILAGPFTLGYLALVMHRAIFGTVFDRYLLPILPVLLIALIRLYQETVSSTLPRLSVAVLALFTLFGIAGTHDIFAVRRARVVAANQLIAAGIPRTAFYGGFEYDGWTQIEAMGFVNSGSMLMPDGFHEDKPIPRKMGRLRPCDNGFAATDPAIYPRFAISFDQAACDGPSTFAPIPYRAWLPPFTRQLYIRAVTKPTF